MRFSIVVALVAAVMAALALYPPTPAEAKRAATPTENMEIAAATGLAPECQLASISTLDGRWAIAYNANVVGDCFPSDGYFVVVRRASGFEVVREASDAPPCPLLKGVVPPRIGLEFGICTRPRTLIGCANNDLTYVLSKFKPRRCLLLAFRGTGLPLRKMRWRSWGGATAYGRGDTVGGSRIRVKLYRPVTVQGNYCYTRLRYWAKFGGGLFRFPRCETDVG